MKKNIPKIILGLVLAAGLVCISGCGSTSTENGVTIEQDSHMPWMPWF